MKLLFKIESNRGHGETDYVFSFSPIELKVLKKLVLDCSRLEPVGKMGNEFKGAHVNMRKCLGKI